MSSIYSKGPVAEPNDEEQDAFSEVYHQLMKVMIKRFGPVRALAIIDWWHIEEVAEALGNGWEPARRRRFMSDLNEAYRCEQEQEAFDDQFRPWVLIPTREP